MFFKALRLILPALFPSWRFFAEVAASPRIQCRLMQDGRWRDWEELNPIPVFITPKDQILRLFWNPKGNDRLFHTSMAERFLTDGDSAAFNALKHLASDWAGASPYQFRIQTLYREGEVIVPLTEYQSDPFGTGAARHVS